MLEGLLCCAVPFVIAGAIFWLWRSWSMRGFQSAIAMDGATCLQADDGSVVIRRHTARNWIVLGVILGLGLPIAVTILWGTISGFVKGESDFLDALGALVLVVGFGSIVGAGVRTLVRAMRRPSVCIHAQAGILEVVGHGSSLRQIPFASVSRVCVELTESGSMGRHRTGVFRIGVVLRNEVWLSLGTVSGEWDKAEERATAIAQLISEVTGASVVGKRTGFSE